MCKWGKRYFIKKTLWTLLTGGVLFGVAPIARALPEDHNRVWMERVEGVFSETSAELVWTTQMESGARGFWVSRVENGTPIPLHDEMIPVDLFRSGGATYRLPDSSQQQGDCASYQFDEVLQDGSVRLIGIWRVCFEPPPIFLSALAAAVADEPMIAAAAAPPLTGPALKVPVLSNDLYRVSFSAIASGLGWTEAAVSNAVVNTNLAMRCGDTPVAYLPNTNAQQIVFYGWPATNRYTRTAFFWIEPGSGAHMQRTAPMNSVVAADQTFYAEVDAEKDLNGGMVEHPSGILHDDLYFWTHIPPGVVFAPDLPLDGYASNDVTCTVRMTGWFNENQEVEIWFNTNTLGTISFVGQGDVSAVFIADESFVLPSENVLKMKGLDGMVIVDGFTTEYERFYEPADSLLRATDGSNGSLCADRFSDPLVLDVTDPFSPVWIADAFGTIPSGWSWAAGANTEWAMSEWSRVSWVSPQVAGFGGWLLDATNAVDYLVIAPHAFEAPAQELAEYRAEMGLRTAVALYEDLCDQFAGGMNTPDAIHDALAYAYENWDCAPWMVVLGGWGHNDYLGAMTSEPNFLPALLGSDSTFLRPVDGLLADVSGNDEIPDLAIGRLPVQNTTQFMNYIAKLKAYEADGLQMEHEHVQFVADNADGGGDFAATNLDLGEETSARYTNAFTTLDSNSVSEVRVEIANAFDSGVGVVHYTGHGAYQQLASENILNTGDVAGMENPAVPLFMSLTCLVGRFDIPTQRGLGEELVLRVGGGSLAVFAPSGLSWNSSAAQFGNEFYALHAEGHADTLGATLLKARQSFGEVSGQFAHAIRTYNLLGDPALKLKGAEGGAVPTWVPTYAHWRWERFSAVELADPGISGDLADPRADGWDNLMDYMFGGYPPRLTEEDAPLETVSVSWNQRLAAADLNYNLLITTNLVTGGWEPPPEEMTLMNTPLGDGVMERLHAHLPFNTDNLFIKVDVTQE